ncbi:MULTISPECIES: DUF4062 domain-containing protein [Flavobacterium]|uniref:DUF4062 domain-containing protein n=1 Tax=Flavobacterium TaxID=237 RepID=UPI0021144C63|nr:MULTISPECIES: DUF4062 domain-containing protein [Flavobacterium]UUF15891.1 DUF4062 domain-containing protein [Flavobacterium panici]
MRDKKFQIFVSSTFTDLKEERQAAVEAILSSGHIPAGMELFSAGDESQMSVIKRWIDESDIYLLILGGRYGSIDSSSGKSYTQLEYEYALQIKKPLFAVIINDSALEEKVKKYGTSVIEKENQSLLNEFKSAVLKNLVKFWDDKKDIKLAIHETISDFIYSKELVGWIRANTTSNPEIYIELNELRKENQEIKSKLDSKEKQSELESLADLNETITISGKHSYYSVYHHGTISSNWSQNLTWGEIFALISPYLLKKPNDANVKGKLSSVIYEITPNYIDSGTSIINDQDFQTIKIQFKALNLIELETIPINAGKKDLLWSTTEKGENLMLSLRTVKSKIP